jgi:hypothetical protein
MKPNDNQKEVIQAISNTVSYWEQTNDINSPSHFSEIDEWWINIPSVSKNTVLEDQLDDLNLKDMISNHITELLYLVRKVK